MQIPNPTPCRNPPQTVPYWVRAIVANQMASTAPEWHDIFYKFNSGTYNNQWMVVDYKVCSTGV